MKSQGSLNDKIEKFVLGLGAARIGFADISDQEASRRKDMPRGIVIFKEIRKDIVNQIRRGPTQDYYKEYNDLNQFLNHVSELTAEYIRSLGYNAFTNPTTVVTVSNDNTTEILPHKTLATKSGIGWIGKSALLVTKEYGPAIRMTGIYTDAPLNVGEPIVSSNCEGCNLCVEACPAGAMNGISWRKHIKRESFYNADKCKEKALELSANAGIDNTICGICIHVCPYTQKYLKSVDK